MANIVLINPPWTFYPGSNGRPGSVPIHVLTAASAFINTYHHVDIIDCTGRGASSRERGDCTDYGYDDNEIRKRLLSIDSPDLIGVSCLWTTQFENAKKCLRIAKECYPNIPVVIGSHHASVLPTECLEVGFDTVCVGEIEGIENEIISNKGIIKNCNPPTDLDNLLWPAYHLVDMESYINSDVRYHGSPISGGVPLITSRGCPYHCSFCTVHLSMGRKWRANSSEYVHGQLVHLKHSFGAKHIYFEDDNLLLDLDRFDRIMDSLGSLSLTWDTPNGVRLDYLSDSMLEKAKESGCIELRVSPESANQKTLDSFVGKSMSLDPFESVAKKCQSIGLQLCAFWVIGIPGETLSDIESTLSAAKSAQDNWGVIPRISIATPFPGTDMMNECVENGWLVKPITPRSLAAATRFDSLIKTSEFSPEDISKLLEGWCTWK